MIALHQMMIKESQYDFADDLKVSARSKIARIWYTEFVGKTR